ncbi:hypothetical protein [Mangrovibrevibacter kandeliae]|uniref:hypothetical protein n=1 Tax=Mangrovibrevibacter kandeliae TaxID=2968473 RepID=UPI0021174F3A|nr:hypothetical protein [Aurantimonas sp. CSK15Z-1]MCQ8781687.1 hypothetical protein [Aurantimonas sp. CSK15Z-1]
MRCQIVTGQRVVCIDDDWGTHNGVLPQTAPVLGLIYTVESLRLINNMEGEVALSLTEWEVSEAWWSAEHFRPLDEARLHRFREHLAPRRVEEPA